MKTDHGHAAPGYEASVSQADFPSSTAEDCPLQQNELRQQRRQRLFAQYCIRNRTTLEEENKNKKYENSDDNNSNTIILTMNIVQQCTLPGVMSGK